jgi:hypothetical protein
MSSISWSVSTLATFSNPPLQISGETIHQTAFETVQSVQSGSGADFVTDCLFVWSESAAL